MKIVIELVDDNARPLSQEAGMKALGIMLADGTEDHGCLELADMEGRALLARVDGVFKPEFDGLVPYITTEVK